MRACHVRQIDPGEISSIQFWDRLVQEGPSAGLEVIDGLLATAQLDHDTTALAHAASGRCYLELGQLAEAGTAVRRALDSGVELSHHVYAWIAIGASVVLAETGAVDEALAELRDLAAESVGADLGRVRLQMAYVLHHSGRLNEALGELDASERLLTLEEDARVMLRVHQNRGLVLLQQGHLGPADDEFERAEALAADLGMTTNQAQSVANRAVLAGRARRLPESMRLFDRAAGLFAAVGNPLRTVACMEIDRAEVMMHSGLVADAMAAGRSAVDLVASSENPLLVGDAQLMLARVELAGARARAAVAAANDALATFRSSDRAEMVSHARSVVVRAGLLAARDADDCRSQLSAASEVVTRLRETGWDADADELCVERVRAARRWGLADLVASDIKQLRAGAIDGRRATALAGWWAEAIHRDAAGDARSAMEACHRGLTILDGIVDEAPSLEARSAAMQMGSDLSRLLTEVAIVLGRADTVLAAAEGTRARALHEELAVATPHHPLSFERADRMRARLTEALGDRVLVEWVVVRDEVWAVVFEAHGARLVRVGSYREVVRARDRVIMWLDLAAGDPDGSSGSAARAASQLDELLIAPLSLPPDAGVVLVPVDLLHGVPWCGLPSLSSRPVVLAPSAQLWLAASARDADGSGGVGIVVGPDVDRNEIEQAALIAAFPGARVTTAGDATADAVSRIFSTSDLVHVAAHGTFRSDRPLMSTLRLAEGEATLYESVPERVNSRLVILSSCEGGAQGTADGSEVLGLSSVLLARGAAAVLAPLTAVRELECAEFVAEVHGELASGTPFAAAVAAVRTRWLADDDLSRWAVASSFTCFGSGAVTVATGAGNLDER